MVKSEKRLFYGKTVVTMHLI